MHARCSLKNQTLKALAPVAAMWKFYLVVSAQEVGPGGFAVAHCILPSHIFICVLICNRDLVLVNIKKKMGCECNGDGEGVGWVRDSLTFNRTSSPRSLGIAIWHRYRYAQAFSEGR